MKFAKQHCGGHPFCVELFEYFLSKGLNPEDKNNEGKSCLDIINKEHLHL